MRSLNIAREADAATEEHWVMGRIIKLQAKVDINEAIKTLSLMRTEDSDVEEALDVIGEAVTGNSGNEVKSWIDKIQALGNLTDSHKCSFLRTLVSKLTNSGIAISEDLLNLLGGDVSSSYQASH